MSKLIPYGIIYLTSRVHRGKVVRRYIGQHRLSRGVEDGYLGSGLLLKQAVEKYGASSFVRETLEECGSLEELNAAERRWIAHFNAVEDSTFYNLSEGGFSVYSIQRKEVHKYALDGTYLTTFASVTEAAKDAGCSEAQMTLTCKSDRRTAKGFQWRFDKFDSVSPQKYGVQRPVACYNSTGALGAVFDSLTAGAKFIGQDTTANIAACCAGNKLTSGGFAWRYFEGQPPERIEVPKKRTTAKKCFQVCPLSGEVLKEFQSVAEAARTIGASTANISRSANAGYRCMGFLWKTK